MHVLRENKVATGCHQVDSPFYVWPCICSDGLQANKRTWSYVTPYILIETRCHYITQRNSILVSLEYGKLRELTDSYLLWVKLELQKNIFSITNFTSLTLLFQVVMVLDISKNIGCRSRPIFACLSKYKKSPL